MVAKSEKWHRRALADCAWGSLITKIGYKAARAGKRLIRIPKYAPTSRTCSACLYVLDAIALHKRSWMCPQCGTHRACETCPPPCVSLSCVDRSALAAPFDDRGCKANRRGATGAGRFPRTYPQKPCASITYPRPLGGAKHGHLGAFRHGHLGAQPYSKNPLCSL
jgi:hypothetical protein